MDAIESPKAWGRYVESAIGAYLVSQAPIHDFKVYYWREKKEEVDFVKYMSINEIKEIIDKGEMTKSHGIIFNKILELKNK